MTEEEGKGYSLIKMILRIHKAKPVAIFLRKKFII